MDKSSNKEIANLRENYEQQQLDLAGIAKDPIKQFDRWFKEAMDGGVAEPNAMTLATANREGRPSARIVLLKDYDQQGFTFYTNFESRKGSELAENPWAALVFCWLELERQIRIEGPVTKVSETIASVYYQSRPKGSQIGAWASPQSTPIPDRLILEEKVEALTAQYQKETSLPKPPHWGGYLVQPHRIEFWQGRTNRLHDRFLYEWQADGSWSIKRLAP